jgi:hypothetical protein
LGFELRPGEGREDNDIYRAVSSAKNAIAFPPASLRSAALVGVVEDRRPEEVRLRDFLKKGKQKDVPTSRVVHLCGSDW